MDAIPKTMQAVRLHGAGFGNIVIEEIPVPEPSEHQILVKVEAAGVCSSILKILAQGSRHTLFNGWDPARYPTILGDEGCVRVVKAGSEVAANYPVGSLYVTQPAVDHPPIHFKERYNNNAEGMNKVAVGYTLPGHLAEYMLISEEILEAQCLLPMTEGAMPFFAGALCEPLSCVISAQDRHIHILQKNPVAQRKPKLGLLKRGLTVIIGAGPMGRLHVEAALRFKPKHIIVVDVMDSRLAWVRDNLTSQAKERGTRLHTVISAEAPMLIDKISKGRGADDIIAAVGVRSVQIEAQEWLARGGVLNLFGGLKRGEHIIDLDSIRVHYDEIRVCGSSGGAPSDVAEAVRMVSAGELDPGRHLDMVGSLDQFSKALELVRNSSVEGKIVLYPGIRQTDLRQTQSWQLADEQAFLLERGQSN